MMWIRNCGCCPWWVVVKISFIPLTQYSKITGHQLINVTTLILKEYVSANHVITSMFVLNAQGTTRSLYALLVWGREIQ
jgi:hypothetical protein